MSILLDIAMKNDQDLYSPHYHCFIYFPIKNKADMNEYNKAEAGSSLIVLCFFIIACFCFLHHSNDDDCFLLYMFLWTLKRISINIF